MSRRSEAVILLSVAALFGALLCPGAYAVSIRNQGDADVEGDPALVMERYLRRLELKPLLAETLRMRLLSAPKSDRGDLAEQLAEIYAELLEATDDPDAEKRWRRLSRELLEIAPETDSIDLRLNLHRAAYTRAERKAEEWRLRLVDPEQREEAMREFVELAPKFDTIGSQAHRRVEQVRRQEESAREQDLGLLDQYKSDARRQRSLAMYLAGWSNTYLAEVGGRDGRAPVAITQFGWLLNARPGEAPEMDRVPAASLQYEHVARAAIGVGICRAVQGRIDDALKWIDLVAAGDDPPESALAESRARRATVLAMANRWDQLLTLIEQERGGDSSTSEAARVLAPGQARLLVVLAKETGKGHERSGARQTLVEIGFSDLVAQGALSHVLDLVKRYGAGVVGTEGFVARYLRGLVAYDEAREAHQQQDSERSSPATAPETQEKYQRAASMFRLALRGDAGAAHNAVRSNARMLFGLSLFYSSGAEVGAGGVEQLIESARALVMAAEGNIPAEERAGALITAMRALDRAADVPDEPGKKAAGLKAEIAQTFLSEFPNHEYAGSLMIQRAESEGTSREEAITTLLQVPQSSNAYEAARRRAARLLYTDYRETGGDRRDWAALRYADVAEPLLFLDLRRARQPDAKAVRLAAARGRRLLESLLSVASPDTERVERVLDNLALLVETHRQQTPDAEALENELKYRRAQAALAAGDVGTASEIVEDLRAGASESPSARRFSEAARRLLVVHSAKQWRSLRRAGVEDQRRVDAARETVRSGARLLSEMNDKRRDSDETVAILALVSDAAHDLWSMTDERDDLRVALTLHDRLLEERPGSPRALKRAATLQEADNRLSEALDSWRTLSSGLASGSADWFEARYNVIRLLAEVAPDRARTVLQQHLTLHPTGGPSPWNDRIMSVARRLSADVDGEGGR